MFVHCCGAYMVAIPVRVKGLSGVCVVWNIKWNRISGPVWHYCWFGDIRREFLIAAL
jgi:hypothetical protein